jgi:hypothetical protein
VYTNNPHYLEAPKYKFVKQFTAFINVNYNFTEICLKEFRLALQQRADILSIF